MRCRSARRLPAHVQPALLHDDMWQAYEIITTPFDRALQQRLGQPTIVVVDAQGAIYVANDPKRFPVDATVGEPRSDVRQIGEPSIARPSDGAARAGGSRPEAVDHGRAGTLQRQHAARDGDTGILARYLQPAFPGDHSQGRRVDRHRARDSGTAGLAVGQADCESAAASVHRRFGRSPEAPAATVAFKAPVGQG